MSPNISLIKALVTTLRLEVETLNDDDLDAVDRPINLPEKVRDYEAKIIKAALVKTGGNQRQAARLLNLKTSTLNTKIKQFGINLFHFKPERDMDAAPAEKYAM
jgi:DNA-binding NtrC family response regulator